ncbi:MAG: flagellar protein FliT [Gammaproteobacteria bacterium]|nr:flagellar protein FliT [Gammaproteobacteria bacterium]MCF6230338.1 flagellar protein FliT [Gammaproteobacteria bacterium]
MSEKLQRLLDAEKVTEKMYALVVEKEWSAMMLLQDERDKNLKEYDLLPVIDAERQLIQVALQRIVTLDEKLRELTENSLQHLSERIGDFNTYRRAQKAYLQNSSS